MGDESLDVTERIIRWDKLTSTNQHEVYRGATLTFSSLKHANEGEYRCNQTITSPYLLSTRTEVQTKEIVVVGKFVCRESVPIND